MLRVCTQENKQRFLRVLGKIVRRMCTKKRFVLKNAPKVV